jgi:adenylate cyclase
MISQARGNAVTSTLSMEKDQLTRKLAIILHADVVDSTSLVQQNETLAHERIQAAFHNFSETIKSYGGFAREIRGDALVAEFNRASDAVPAAIAFQALNEESNNALDDDIRPQLRIGISLGEVIIADNTITGSGVVLAQRLEQLADPDGVVTQGSVSETVPNRMPFEFESLGEHVLKGFNQPVKAFVATLKSGEKPPAPEKGASAHGTESGGPLVSDEPSIAVLSFTNMSNDPEQEFFSDGISEDIITALSKISALMVVARNSTFVYKGKAVDIMQVGREQGVRYVLEGSVRKAGNRVRITAQLIDAMTGKHIWAERYDRNLDDIFELQDEITRKIVTALDVQLVSGEQARLWSSGTKNLKAWESARLALNLRGLYRVEDLPEVMRLLEKAIDLDPEYAFAWALMAGCNSSIADDPKCPKEKRIKALELIKECAEHALRFDPACSKGYTMLGLYHLNARDYDEAEYNANKAIEMSPNHANELAVAAGILNKCGNPEFALERIRKAMRLSPVHPMWFLTNLGQIFRVLGRYDDSIDVFTRMIRRDPDFDEGHIGLADILGEVGRAEEAKSAATELLRVNPKFSIEAYTRILRYRDPTEITRLQNGLRNAGLPE